MLLKTLGAGSAGTVYFARPSRRSRGVPTPVVIKTLHEELSTNPELVARFRHEAELAVVVSSEHVARVYDAGMVGSTLYIAMEFVPGSRLSLVLNELQNRQKLLPLESTLRVFLGGLRGLEALHGAKDPDGHSLGIVHRDLSPKNLMVTTSGEMKLIDLGLGKSKLQGWKTQTGTVMGSPGYMAPEQVRGKPATAASDLYAMGTIFWEMLTARAYIPRGSLSEVLLASASPRFTPPSKHRSSIPREIDELLERCLKPNADDRDISVSQLRGRIERLLSRVPRRESGTIPLADVSSIEQNVEELRQLLSLQPPRRSDSVTGEHTVVFAARSGLQPITEEDFEATELFEPDIWDPTKIRTDIEFGAASLLDATTVDTHEPRTTVDAYPDPTRIEGTVTEPNRSRPGSAPSSSPSHPSWSRSSPGEPRRFSSAATSRHARSVPLGAVVLLVAAAVALGVVAGRVSTDPVASDPTPASTNAPALQAWSKPPRVEPEIAVDEPTRSATIAASDSDPRGTADPDSARPGPKRSKRVTRRPKPPKEVEPEAKPAPPEKASEPTVTELAERLTKKARRLKQSQPEQRAAIDVLLSDIAMETASGDTERAKRRLIKLGRQLDELAKP